MPRFEHQRHKPPTALDAPRELIVACAAMRSNVNLSRIVRTAGGCGVRQVICCGAALAVEVRMHRTLAPPLAELREGGYQLVGLEQTTQAENLHTFAFARRTVLVVGNERLGLTDDVLSLLDRVVEIPVYGLPHAYNVATATAMALYEYCRQFPRG
jgi:tRNA G18 (ribose-2'-O)-methylase SpoU